MWRGLSPEPQAPSSKNLSGSLPPPLLSRPRPKFWGPGKSAYFERARVQGASYVSDGSSIMFLQIKSCVLRPLEHHIKSSRRLMHERSSWQYPNLVQTEFWKFMTRNSPDGVRDGPKATTFYIPNLICYVPIPIRHDLILPTLEVSRI